MFQSLRGFGVGWSAQGIAYHHVEGIVSIPERVWGGLEPAQLFCLWAEEFVSIPERVWGGLEPVTTTATMAALDLFQSLRGFGVGWSSKVVL